MTSIVTREICCICGTQRRGRWYKRDNYEIDFAACFGIDVSNGPPNSETRDLCSSCRSDVSRYRSHGKTKFGKLDSLRGKKGRPGHRNIGGVRAKSKPEEYVDPPIRPTHKSYPNPNTNKISDQTEQVQENRETTSLEDGNISDTSTGSGKKEYIQL